MAAGLCYGSMFALVLALTADLFGPRHVGTNYGLMDLGELDVEICMMLVFVRLSTSLIHHRYSYSGQVGMSGHGHLAHPRCNCAQLYGNILFPRNVGLCETKRIVYLGLMSCFTSLSLSDLQAADALCRVIIRQTTLFCDANLLCVGPALGSFLFATGVVALFYEDTKGGESSECVGPQCFGGTFFTTAMSCLGACVLVYVFLVRSNLNNRFLPSDL